MALVPAGTPASPGVRAEKRVHSAMAALRVVARVASRRLRAAAHSAAGQAGVAAAAAVAAAGLPERAAGWLAALVHAPRRFARPPGKGPSTAKDSSRTQALHTEGSPRMPPSRNSAQLRGGAGWRRRGGRQAPTAQQPEEEGGSLTYLDVSTQLPSQHARTAPRRWPAAATAGPGGAQRAPARAAAAPHRSSAGARCTPSGPASRGGRVSKGCRMDGGRKGLCQSAPHQAPRPAPDPADCPAPAGGCQQGRPSSAPAAGGGRRGRRRRPAPPARAPAPKRLRAAAPAQCARRPALPHRSVSVRQKRGG